MTVNNSAFLKGVYGTVRAMGDKAVSSDAAFEIEGFEGMWLLAKQFPWPVSSVGQEIEIPGPNGMNTVQPGQQKVAHNGPVTFFETEAGAVDNLMLQILSNGGRFNAKVYAGVPTAHRGIKQIVDCFFVLDDPDRDWENRAQALTISGTIHYHYFGEKLPGNL